jgi:uncharacterized protein YggT (Ycf19 family)
MSSIDLLLNIAGLLLWLNWRSFAYDPLLKTSPATLVGTLKRTDQTRFKRWQILLAIGSLLLVRALFYWQLGPTTDWTPKIDLLVVVLPFQTNFFSTALLFSVCSFVRSLTVLYFWFLALAVVGRGLEETEPLNRLIRLQLGRVSRLPRVAQIAIPFLLVTLLWAAMHPVMVHANTITPAKSWLHLLGQGALISAALYLSLKYLLPPLLLVYLVISYVYVGRSPLWDYITAISQRLLRPFRGIPLRFARIDFGPLVAAAFILVALDALPKYLLVKAAQSGFQFWPQ